MGIDYAIGFLTKHDKKIKELHSWRVSRMWHGGGLEDWFFLQIENNLWTKIENRYHTWIPTKESLLELRKEIEKGRAKTTYYYIHVVENATIDKDLLAVVDEAIRLIDRGFTIVFYEC